MTAALHNTTQLAGYGAVELKKLAGKHAFYGLFLSVGIIGAVFLLSFIVTSVLGLGKRAELENRIGTIPIVISHLPAQPDVSIQEVVPVAPKGKNGQGISTIVEPVGPSIGSIASNVPISAPVFTEEGAGSGNNNPFGDPSTSVNNGVLGGLGGESTDTVGSNSEGGLDWEEVPDVFPYVDMQQLQRNIVYPELALRRDLEGKVVISVLIDAEGKLAGSSILQSTHSAFNDAALTAVRKSSFTPAFRNGKPVSFRLIIPVTFMMRR